jgi:elongator complex protein 3
VETLLLDILTELRAGEGDRLDDRHLAQIIHRHNKGLGGNGRQLSKKKLLPYYLRVKESDPERWAGWNVDEATEGRLLQVLRMKPRRTASGVATITVISKPWSCSSNCLYCPSDVRMPKSYLSDEPACQRAERNYFDPYLQVVSRLRALTHMGHPTDKVELIVLGGTWSDYPEGYQTWFVTELFRALNDGEDAEQGARMRRGLYRERGCESRAEELSERVRETQQKVDDGTLTYNQAIGLLYGESDTWQGIVRGQAATFDDLTRQHRVNQSARHRVVGLVVETRPDTVTAGSLTLLRRLGCTKVQIGVQSLDIAVLRLNNRAIDSGRVREAFELLRLFGFKTHVHFMANLYGSSPEKDKQDYRHLVTDGAYLPDEVKLYPCSLVAGTGLVERYRAGDWRPYSEGDLLDVLVADTLVTPGFMRISRMVRDISAQDIMAGNRKANLRQLVERRIEEAGERIAEMRYREIGTGETDLGCLVLEAIAYETTVSSEHFLQWVTPENRLVGFLRLSLPSVEYVRRHQAVLPVGPYEAMIREVHVYGTVVPLRKAGEGGWPCAEGEGARPEGLGEGAQHLGLGRRLVEAACDIARAQGYRRINVISAVGTREYYQSLGFEDGELYQQMPLLSG